MKLYEYVRMLFFMLLIIYVTPFLVEGIHKQYSKYLEPKTAIGVIPIKEVIHDSTDYAQQLYAFFKDPEIKAIVLQIDCPGSAAGTSHALFNEIKTLKKIYPKPIITRIENTCTSGGYLVACASDYIVAPSSALIGSIGVTLPYLFQLREFLEQHHVQHVTLQTGTYKNIGNPFTDISDEQKQHLQCVLDDTYEQFITTVAQARKISLSTLSEWADGKLFTSNQALKLGLIDQIGSLQTIITIIKDKALIEGELEWVYPTQKNNWLSTFNHHLYKVSYTLMHNFLANNNHYLYL